MYCKQLHAYSFIIYEAETAEVSIRMKLTHVDCSGWPEENIDDV
jgi:hypothetical protein